MRIIGGARGCGKTTELIKQSARTQYYIVCADKNRSRMILQMAKTLDLKIPCPITLDDLPLRGACISKVLIDDADTIFEMLVGHHIDLCSVSCSMEHM